MPIVDLAVVLMFIVLILTTGTVALLRPLVKPLASLLEAKAATQRRRLARTEEEPVYPAERLRLLEERLEQLEEERDVGRTLPSPRRDSSYR